MNYETVLSLEDNLSNMASSEVSATLRDLTSIHGQDSNFYHFLFVFFVFLFFYGRSHGMWKFQGQLLNLSHSCNQEYCWGNATSLNSLCPARARTRTSTATRATEVRFLTHCTTVGTPEITWLHFLRYVFWVRNSMPGNCHLLVTICCGFLNIWMTICKFPFQENFRQLVSDFSFFFTFFFFFLFWRGGYIS